MPCSRVRATRRAAVWRRPPEVGARHVSGTNGHRHNHWIVHISPRQAIEGRATRCTIAQVVSRQSAGSAHQQPTKHASATRPLSARKFSTTPAAPVPEVSQKSHQTDRWKVVRGGRTGRHAFLPSLRGGASAGAFFCSREGAPEQAGMQAGMSLLSQTSSVRSNWWPVCRQGSAGVGCLRWEWRCSEGISAGWAVWRPLLFLLSSMVMEIGVMNDYQIFR